MSQNEKNQKRRSEYENLHKTVIVNEGLKPIKVIAPIILICVIIAIMSLYSYIQKKNIIEDAEQVTNQMAEYIVGSIDNEMDYARSSIRFASDAISRTMTSESIEAPAEIITPMVVNTPFGGVEYIRPDGMNVMNIGEPFDASDRVYYIEGIKGNTGIWNNFHPKTSKETLMNFYTPLIYEGKIAGVLTGYIAATSQISPLFEKKLYGQDIYGFLVDENDMVICSTIESEYVKDLSLEVFMDNLGVDKDKKQRLRETINNAKDEAASYKDEKGEERVCVVKVPDTEWKVVILVPEASFKAIISNNTRNSVITIIAIALLLISYGSAVLLKNVKRRKEIARENAKLEEENRIYNEENKRAFLEISAIRDIIASAEMGTWRIELEDGKEPRMFVDNTMKALLGISGQDITAEETYRDWYDNITPQAVPSVIASVNKMKEGSFDENTYLWRHPVKGERYVRCGGTAQKTGYGYLISGYHYDVDDVVREDQAKVVMLKNALNEKNDYYNTLGTLADIYNSLQVIDLVEDSIIDFNNDDKFKDLISPEQGANKIISGIMSITATDECKDRALEFLDLSTLAERMKNKKYISTQLISKRIGWFLATFITMETDESKRPKRVILTTQSIDEAKKQEEFLIHRSRTDELTGLLNRRAYEEDIYEHNDLPVKDDFVIMSLDVNKLKIVNDSMGHAAGDELLIGACECMKKCLGPYGNIYRTGGDEFIAILYCEKERLKKVLAAFEDTMAKWKGRFIDSLTISYGYISKEEEPQMSIRELGIIADKRMYDAKTDYYRKNGMDRSGNQDAHKALYELYTKILKINITDDSFQVINMDKGEERKDKGYTDSISAWLSSYGKNGNVHPEDLDDYLKKTDLQYMRDYFSENKTPLRIFYRRKYEEKFKKVMMEIIPASDYSEEKQSLYLYVKDIEK